MWKISEELGMFWPLLSLQVWCLLILVFDERDVGLGCCNLWQEVEWLRLGQIKLRGVLCYLPRLWNHLLMSWKILFVWGWLCYYSFWSSLKSEAKTFEWGQWASNDFVFECCFLFHFKLFWPSSHSHIILNIKPFGVLIN